MPKPKTGWSGAEEYRLQQLWERGLKDPEIASRLRRTERAVAIKRNKLGLRKFSVTRKSIKDYSDETLIRELRRRGGYDVIRW